MAPTLLPTPPPTLPPTDRPLPTDPPTDPPVDPPTDGPAPTDAPSSVTTAERQVTFTWATNPGDPDRDMVDELVLLTQAYLQDRLRTEFGDTLPDLTYTIPDGTRVSDGTTQRIVTFPPGTVEFAGTVGFDPEASINAVIISALETNNGANYRGTVVENLPATNIFRTAVSVIPVFRTMSYSTDTP